MSKLQDDLEKFKQAEFFNSMMHRYTLDQNVVDRLYDESIDAINKGLFNGLQDAIDKIINSYSVYTEYHRNHFLEIPNKWLKIGSEKSFKLKQVRLEKLREINKTL